MRASSLVLALLLAGCASGGSSADGEAQASAPRVNRDLLTAEEIATKPVSSAYDAIQQLRPNYLRRRPKVYVNGQRQSLNFLQSVRAETVIEVRYMDGPDATTRYGTDHGDGAIEVKTR